MEKAEKDEKDKKRRNEVMRIVGWKNKRETDVEDGRGRSKRRKFYGLFTFGFTLTISLTL